MVSWSISATPRSSWILRRREAWINGVNLKTNFSILHSSVNGGHCLYLGSDHAASGVISSNSIQFLDSQHFALHHLIFHVLKVKHATHLNMPNMTSSQSRSSSLRLLNLRIMSWTQDYVSILYNSRKHIFAVKKNSEGPTGTRSFKHRKSHVQDAPAPLPISSHFHLLLWFGSSPTWLNNHLQAWDALQKQI